MKRLLPLLLVSVVGIPLKVAVKTTKQVAAKGPRAAVVSFGQYRVMGMNALWRAEGGYSLRALSKMAKRGKSGVNTEGQPLHLHHLGRKAEGPFVLIPAKRHDRWNKRQHPDGPGLTKEERRHFNRVIKPAFWKREGRRILRERYEAGEVSSRDLKKVGVSLRLLGIR